MCRKCRPRYCDSKAQRFLSRYFFLYMFSKFDVDAIIFFNSHCYIMESAILLKIVFGGVLLLTSNLLARFVEF